MIRLVATGAYFIYRRTRGRDVILAATRTIFDKRIGAEQREVIHLAALLASCAVRDATRLKVIRSALGTIGHV